MKTAIRNGGMSWENDDVGVIPSRFAKDKNDLLGNMGVEVE
jgi:hypothetical protein